MWQKYSKFSRIEFVCFSFHVGLLSINFSSFKPNTESSKRARFDEVLFLKHSLAPNIWYTQSTDI